MPFKISWPFSWPRRKRPLTDAADNISAPPEDARQPASESAASEQPAPAAVQPQRAEPPSPPAGLAPVNPPLPEVPAAAGEAAGPDLGLELLARQTALSTPPMLGRLGGLPAMAQTLPTVDRFLQRLPAPPPEPLLAGLSEASDFAANLPSLIGFTSPASADQAPAFPAQLEPPSEPTNILAPPGGIPGQVAALSGAAPLLAPERPPAAQPLPAAAPAPTPLAPPTPAPLAARLPSAQAPAAAPSAPVQRALETEPAAKPPTLPAPPVAPAIVPPGQLVQPGVWQPAGPMTNVLPLAQTLTGNVLPGSALEPIQRAVTRPLETEWEAPSDFVRAPEAAGERVTPAQRETIESQRGQGQPLEPETRQRFEQAYGQPLDEVRVHTGPAAHAAAESLNAIAFASGTDLFFTQNTFAPDSAQGLSLLGHELAHVIQQQYGVAGDADALRPPDDRYERQADQLAARALETPVARPAPAAGAAAPAVPGAAVQRTPEDEPRQTGAMSAVPPNPAWTPGQQLASADNAAPQTLASGALSPARRLPEDQPVQLMAANGPALSSSAVAATSPAAPAALPLLSIAPQRAGSLTEQLLRPASMLPNRLSLSQSLPGLGPVSQAGQALPIFRSISRGLPGLGSVPDLTRTLPDLGQSSLPDTEDLTNQLPSLPQGLPGLGGVAPSMPDLGGLAQGLGAPGLPQMPQMPGLPALGGLTPPAMPLAQGLGALGQAAGGAAEAADEAAGAAQNAGQQAMGTINSIGPSSAEGPAAPPLPSLDKLTEHIWKEVQRKLKVERERSRGLA